MGCFFLIFTTAFSGYRIRKKGKVTLYSRGVSVVLVITPSPKQRVAKAPEQREQQRVQHMVEIHKLAKNRLNEEKIDQQVGKIVSRVMTSAYRDKGWSCLTEDPGRKLMGSDYLYRRHLKLNCEPRKTRADKDITNDFNNIVRALAKAGTLPEWRVAFMDGKSPAADDDRMPREMGYATVEMPINWNAHFAHIFDRDQQIGIIKSSVEAAISSDWTDRFHVAMIGPPASGKSETCRGIKSAFGEDSILEFDATVTTMAGAIKDIERRQELPRIFLVEEIEKTNEESLRWLLAALDIRAEIRKKNFNQNIHKETKMLCVATVNDYKLFKKIMYGALASRFAWHLNYPHPDPALLYKILDREVTRVRGNKKWIKPTLDFAAKHEIFDPRKLIAVCLCGRDRLLNNHYQNMMEKCTQITMN